VKRGLKQINLEVYFILPAGENTSAYRYFDKHLKQCLKLLELFREVTISFVSITFNRLIRFFRTVKQNKYTNVFRGAFA